jgi:hypothetical protein
MFSINLAYAFPPGQYARYAFEVRTTDVRCFSLRRAPGRSLQSALGATSLGKRETGDW